MPTLKFTNEGESTPFRKVSGLGYVPVEGQFIDLNGASYKVEKVVYQLTIVGGSPSPSNPEVVSESYAEIFLSVVP